MGFADKAILLLVLNFVDDLEISTRSPEKPARYFLFMY
jgi:hypothetical protein